MPADAELWFEGDKTTQTGTERAFVSPPLRPSQDFTYDIHARWKEGTKVVDQTRHVQVHAGRGIMVDFLAQ
jgi:uncharacterized protein (TIGR03000 family)